MGLSEMYCVLIGLSEVKLGVLGFNGVKWGLMGCTFIDVFLWSYYSSTIVKLFVLTPLYTLNLTNLLLYIKF